MVQVPVSLSNSGGSERPARSTLSLILNWSNSSLGSPVEWLNGSVDLFVSVLDLSVSRFGLLEVDSDPLFLGQIGELVDFQLVRLLGGIGFLDHLPVLDENSESEILDHLVGISLVVLSLPESELLLERLGKRGLEDWSFRGRNGVRVN